jgi:hypothetical protein
LASIKIKINTAMGLNMTLILLADASFVH